MLRYLAPAALIAFLPISAASAAPAASTRAIVAPDAAIQLVDIRRDMRRDYRRDMRRDHRRDLRRDGRHHRHRYTPGKRYRNAPPGWRQYRSRPNNWRTRGCVIVGPIWFCP